MFSTYLFHYISRYSHSHHYKIMILSFTTHCKMIKDFVPDILGGSRTTWEKKQRRSLRRKAWCWLFDIIKRKSTMASSYLTLSANFSYQQEMRNVLGRKKEKYYLIIAFQMHVNAKFRNVALTTCLSHSLTPPSWPLVSFLPYKYLSITSYQTYKKFISTNYYSQILNPILKQCPEK